jgi:ABC-type amino acid transport substrate-binding protein
VRVRVRASTMTLVVRAHLPLEPPYVYRTDRASKNSPLTGFLYDVWARVAIALRARGYDVIESVGPPAPTDHWVEAVANGTYDIVVTPTVQNAARLAQARVSAPLYVTYFSLVQRSTAASWVRLVARLALFELVPLFVGLCLAGLALGYAMYRLSHEASKRAFFSYAVYNVINMFGTSSNLTGFITQNNLTKRGRPRRGSASAWWWGGIFILVTAAAVVISTMTRAYITTRMVQEKIDLGKKRLIDMATIGKSTVLARAGSHSAAAVRGLAKRVYYEDAPIAQMVRRFVRDRGRTYDAMVMQTVDAREVLREHPALVESTVDIGASAVGIAMTRRPERAALVALVDRHIERMKAARWLFATCKRYLTDNDAAACLV